MSFDRPTLPALVEQQLLEIESRLPGAEARLRQSNLNVLGRVFAGGLHQQYGFLEWLSRQCFPDTADDEFAERWAAIWLAEGRKPAVIAQGLVHITGNIGAVLPAGSVFVSSAGLEYQTLADATIGAGGADVAVGARVVGLAGNMASGAALTLVNPVAGIVGKATVNAPGLTQGTDIESIVDLRQRVLRRIQTPPQGGSVTDYVQWATSVAGVTRAWVLPGQLGVGTVVILFVRDGDTPIIPDAAEVATVQSVIDFVRPVTAAVTVVAPTPKACNFTIQLTPANAATKAAVTASLQSLLAREGAPGKTLLLSQINEAISIATGETDHVLTVPSANVTHAALEMPVMGAITWA